MAPSDSITARPGPPRSVAPTIATERGLTRGSSFMGCRFAGGPIIFVPCGLVTRIERSHEDCRSLPYHERAYARLGRLCGQQDVLRPEPADRRHRRPAGRD